MKPINEPPDTVLDELHATRRQLLQQHGGVAGLAAFLRQQEAKCTEQIVQPTCDFGPNNGMQPTGNRPVRRIREE